MESVVVLIGNDGTGKSTVAEKLDTEKIRVVERSCKHASIVPQIGLLDKMTLMHTFDPEFNEQVLPTETESGTPIFYVVLDCAVDVILRRIKGRQISDVWETEKALHYFRQRFRQLSAHFGIPFIDTTNRTIDQVCNEVRNIVANRRFYDMYREIGTKYLTIETVRAHDVEELLYPMIRFTPSDLIELKKMLPTYYEMFSGVDLKRLYVRWYVNHHKAVVSSDRKTVKIGDYELVYGTLFLLAVEGESKQVYVDISDNPYTRNLAFICLKSTIYSHSMQATGTIQGLGAVRATGTQLYLEMMWRNKLSHSYRSINSFGIIISDWIDCPPLEIVVKRYCEGTDKHTFHQIRNNPDIVIQETGEYRCGLYMRTDWRNPNHVDKTGNKMNAHMFYYLIEAYAGKEQFFELILRNPAYVTPFGDRCVPEDIVCDTMDLDETRKSVFQIFTTIQAYFNKVGLLVKDACFMLNKAGTVFWSEINQDCMRIVAVDGSDKFDKDLWRAGGSGSKDIILQKWIQFNRILGDYFTANRFHKTELLQYNSYPYQEVVKSFLNNPRLKIPARLMTTWNAIMSEKKSNRVIFTMDMMNGKPVLVKSGVVSEIHTAGNPLDAIEKIAIYPDILVVDLDGATGTPHDESPNREIIKKFGIHKYIHTGGGIRTVEHVQDMLSSSIRRVVLGSADDELIRRVPKDRLIVEVTVNEKNEILIHGRKTNTGINIIERLVQLANMGVEAISITFHQTEGHLNGIPREQIRKIVLQVPRSIRKIIIAGGISSLDDLDYLWSMNRVIPQLGSVIWKNMLTVGQVVAHSLNYDQNGLIPSVIQDINGTVKGLVYLNKESVIRTCDNRTLWRYSRKQKMVIMKGAISGDVQKVLAVAPDCDSDTLLITVDSTHPMCHTGNFSCFPMQTVAKASVSIIRDHIRTRINSDSYSGQMQRIPALALAKLMEEFWEIVTAPTDAQVHEVSDLFIHLIMYLNGISVNFEDILNELNRRRWKPNLIDTIPSYKKHKNPNEVVIGITGAKYSDKTDDYIRDHLGIQVHRGLGRSLLVTGEIVNQTKYSRFFGEKSFCFITARPKDMAWLLALGRIDFVVTYETTIKNFPKVYTPIHEVVDPTIALCLIKRKNDVIDPTKWTSENRILIAAEHPCHIAGWMEANNIPSEHVHMDRIIGSSEGFLLQTDMYALCDAVVESGRTLDDNDLEVFATIIPKGSVKMGLYGKAE